MNTKRIIYFMLAVTILVACGGNPPTATSIPTLSETAVVPVTGDTATLAPVATDTSAVPADFTATPTNLPVSATPEPPRPTNAPGCTNSAAFVADVTIPDNTQLAGAEEFVKTWRIVNNGTCIWASDYTLTYYSEERMNAPAAVSLPLTFPGQTADISIPLTAPNSIGKHRGNFVVKNAEGLIMKIGDDSRLWLIINVGSTVAPTAAATATAAAQAPSAPAATTGAGGDGFANVTCAYAIDQSKLIEVITAVNAYRAQSGLPAYNVNPQLASAAQAHANDMACNNLFVHTGSNGSTPDSRIKASGYVAAFKSENVYGSFPPLSGQDVVNWWKNDKTDVNHNLNLISDTFIDIGVGYAFFNNYGYYVIVFASP
ncbi:MAG TPA: CAP domain-containing protein [Anaerolineales bacterium]|nr:CAP domain-containing protein [Anaerolineales bacterium]